MSYGKIFPLGGSGGLTSPSGIAGAIQFSNGSAFASDAANFFWDNTNKRLGVGTNAPSGKTQIITDDATSPFAYSSQLTQLAGSALQGLLVGYSSTNGSFISSVFPGNSFLNMTYTAGEHRFSNAGTIAMTIHTNGNTTLGNGTTSLGARVGIKGSGSTSATTSLLVQNSVGDNLLRATDDGIVAVGTGATLRFIGGGSPRIRGFNDISIEDDSAVHLKGIYAGNTRLPQTVIVGANTTQNASAQLQIDSTTRGFLPPRGTNAQMLAIVSPAEGLVFYDLTNHKLNVFDGTSWVAMH